MSRSYDQALVETEEELTQAEVARDDYNAEITAMVHRLRRLIAVGLVSEAAGQYIRTGTEGMTPEAREALATQIPIVR